MKPTGQGCSCSGKSYPVGKEVTIFLEFNSFQNKIKEKTI